MRNSSKRTRSTAPASIQRRREVSTEPEHVVVRKLRLRYSAKTRIEFISDAKGYGVVAAEPIAQGAFVMEFAGELVSADEARRREAVYERTLRSSFLLAVPRTEFVVDPTARRRVYGNSPYLNHAIDERTLFPRRVRVDGVWRVAMHATCDIAVGDELTFDYNERRAELIKARPWLQRPSTHGA